MVYSLGMGKSGITSFEDINEVRDLISESTKERLEKEVEEIINQCTNKAHDLLHRNRVILDELVKELLERETLNRRDVQEIIERTKKGKLNASLYFFIKIGKRFMIYELRFMNSYGARYRTFTSFLLA